MRYGIYTSYYAGGESSVELPEGKTWADVEWWYVKWDTLFYKLVGDDKEYKEELNTDIHESVDWKRPAETQIFELDENRYIDWEKEVAYCEY